MAGAFAGWWAKMSPYYTKAYQEMWVGVGVMTFLYYKVSYGGKKAAVDSSAHAAKSAPSHTAKPATSAAAAAAAAAAATATSLAVAAGDVTMSDILQRQHKNLVLEERKLYLEIEKLELEKAKLKSMK
ncbi:ATP synthase subunit ATP5MPL, mitochondrial [Alosa sapidissima]|uniref:ATP synthase subunit ATP5MPL, mitochondrial n=1 Tax=Alosa sapidissima TaxID=34773 RepID=UPI001C09E66F|nr:ATP synthase subunit ATP5MPL, mitochondrial [Alosa sapidissima]